ncbi:hypothetical protein BYT27DRAFT_7144604 [Phlegmacium glaucopus]|nr:hypothetical protein BYT27DRAFT_7144604 [Phlegmacium glaucopus]
MDIHQNRRSEAEGDAFISTILKPGSSLHPTFLFIVDAAFLCLLLVLVTLVFLTAKNPHIFALIFIEFCLWGSVKWFIHEFRTSHLSETQQNTVTSQDETKGKNH